MLSVAALATVCRAEVDHRVRAHDAIPGKTPARSRPGSGRWPASSGASHARARGESIDARLEPGWRAGRRATSTAAMPSPKAITSTTPAPSRPSAAERTTRPTASQQGTSPPAMPSPRNPARRETDRWDLAVRRDARPSRRAGGRAGRSRRRRSRTPQTGPAPGAGRPPATRPSTRGSRRSASTLPGVSQGRDQAQKAGWYHRAPGPSAIADTRVLPCPGWIGMNGAEPGGDQQHRQPRGARATVEEPQRVLRRGSRGAAAWSSARGCADRLVVELRPVRRPRSRRMPARSPAGP